MSFIKTYGRCHLRRLTITVNKRLLKKTVVLNGLQQIRKELSDAGYPNKQKLLSSEGILFIEGYDFNNNRAISPVKIENKNILVNVSGNIDLIISSVSSVENNSIGKNIILWKDPQIIIDTKIQHSSDLLSFVGENITINPIDFYNTTFKIIEVQEKNFIVDKDETFILVPVKDNKVYEYTVTENSNKLNVLSTDNELNVEDLKVEIEYVNYDYFFENFNGIRIS